MKLVEWTRSTRSTRSISGMESSLFPVLKIVKSGKSRMASLELHVTRVLGRQGSQIQRNTHSSGEFVILHDPSSKVHDLSVRNVEMSVY